MSGPSVLYPVRDWRKRNAELLALIYQRQAAVQPRDVKVSDHTGDWRVYLVAPGGAWHDVTGVARQNAQAMGFADLRVPGQPPEHRHAKGSSTVESRPTPAATARPGLTAAFDSYLTGMGGVGWTVTRHGPYTASVSYTRPSVTPMGHLGLGVLTVLTCGAGAIVWIIAAMQQTTTTRSVWIDRTGGIWIQGGRPGSTPELVLKGGV